MLKQYVGSLESCTRMYVHVAARRFIQPVLYPMVIDIHTSAPVLTTPTIALAVEGPLRMATRGECTTRHRRGSRTASDIDGRRHVNECDDGLRFIVQALDPRTAGAATAQPSMHAQEGANRTG
eukprot:COSAG02_NODE_22616_length_746_cov_1.267388_1_plen_122_part_10